MNEAYYCQSLHKIMGYAKFSRIGEDIFILWDVTRLDVMRLTSFQAESIKNAFKKNFEPCDKLWLFGSRVDPNKRGGDIDLYIETEHTDVSVVAKKQLRFLGDIKAKIGEQKIDVVINVLALDQQLPIYNEARKTGIRLV